MNKPLTKKPPGFRPPDLPTSILCCYLVSGSTVIPIRRNMLPGTLVIINSTWWLLMTCRLFGAKASAMSMLTYGGPYQVTSYQEWSRTMMIWYVLIYSWLLVSRGHFSFNFGTTGAPYLTLMGIGCPLWVLSRTLISIHGINAKYAISYMLDLIVSRVNSIQLFTNIPIRSYISIL